MLRGMCSVFSFLTIVPAPGATLESTAKNMHLFPLAGAAMGLAVGALALGLSLAVDPLLVGLLVAASIVVLTGAHHADGLADFADGLMARGGRARRLAVMGDSATGTAGTVGTVLSVAGLVAAVSLSGGTDLLRALVVAEVLAKFAMVLAAYLGSPAAPGSGSAFAAAMDRKRLAAAAIVTVILAVALGGAAGLLALGAVLVLAAVLLAVSARSFGGITGDVLGAANETARLASLVVFVSA